MKIFPKRIYYEMTTNEFDRLVKEVWPDTKYEFHPDEEVSNYCYRSFVVKKGKLESWDKDKFEDFESNKDTMYMADVLLQVMANKGIIPEGNYLVDTSW